MKKVLFVALVVVLMLTLALPVFAEGRGPSPCKDQASGEFISAVAQITGLSGTVNPGNAHSDSLPFVPFVDNIFHVACNPNA